MGSLPYLMAKAHANHSKSPTRAQINSMLSANSISEVETILMGTGYADMVTEARPSVDIANFEKALRKGYGDLLHKYRKSAPEKAAKILDAYSIVIDAENINLILQAIIRGNKEFDVESVITPVGKYGIAHYQRMLGTSTVENALDFIPYPEVKRAINKAIKISDNPDDQVFYISSALSHVSFENLHRVIPRLMRPEIELLNLETICRAVNMGISAKDWLIPNNGVVDKSAAYLSSMKSPREVISNIYHKFPIKGPLHHLTNVNDEELVAVLEDRALQYLYARHYRRFFGGNSEVALMAFFAIKKAELEDISRLVLAAGKSIPTEVVQKMLFPIYSSR